MPAPHAVVSGASIAGLSTAYWLRRVGWEVTVLERHPTFRDGGQNVDVRGVAHQVLERMDLTEVVRSHHTTETGTVMVDGDGAVIGELPSGDQDAATAELEILRGDFARVLLEALPPGVEMAYDESVERVEEHPDRVSVLTTRGRTLRADLLVVAEGVRSRTRDLLFPDLVERHPLDITMAFGTIPRTDADDSRWRWYNAVQGRQVHLRPDNHGTTRAILAHTGDEGLAALDHTDALARLRERHADAGWEARRVLDGFDDSADVYVDDLTRITMPQWFRGRVCLVGDAAWCVTPLGGGGTSLALTSGYVLAARLSTLGTDELEAALTAYQDWMRPLVDKAGTMPPGVKRFAFPETEAGLKLRHLADRAMTSPPLDTLAAKIPQVAGTDQALPELVTAG